MNRESTKGEAEEVCRQILRKITPSRKEKTETLRFSQKLADDLTAKLRRSRIRAEVNIQGSIAKDTWLAGEKDIDVFIAVSKSDRKEGFTHVLDIVKSFAGRDWVEAYAEHPYIKATVDGYKVDFVPCFKIERAEEATSSVDRTPLHTAYVRRRVNQRVKREIRLLKRFMLGIGTYGAEIKVKGFSGYLCELLILYYGSFLNMLAEIERWKFGQVIDLDNSSRKQGIGASHIFHAPLIVIDPVDAKRNVAANVSKDKMGELVMASKLFLAKPSKSFFFSQEISPLRINELEERLAELQLDLIFVVFTCVEAIPDILWGELYKTVQAVKRLLTQYDFQVLRNSTWNDGGETSVLLFGLESITIPSSRKHVGPPADCEEAMRFIKKYTKSGRVDNAVSGPWIEDGRWIVRVRRPYVDAAALLSDVLKNNVENIGVANKLIASIREAKIYVNNRILHFYSTNPDFARFLTNFLRGRPQWME